MRPADFASALEYGIGLTDLCKLRSGSDLEIGDGAFDVAGLETRLLEVAPRVIAFNGLKAGREALGGVDGYGRQTRSLADAETWVLPSTSGAANRWWDPGGMAATRRSSPVAERLPRRPRGPALSLGRGRVAGDPPRDAEHAPSSIALLLVVRSVQSLRQCDWHHRCHLGEDTIKRITIRSMWRRLTSSDGETGHERDALDAARSVGAGDPGGAQ